MPRLLIVNADDFGFTRDVNRGIVEAHTRGILTATTLMANGGAFADAAALAREHPSLDVGCHLVLVQGDSVARRGVRLPATLKELVQTLCVRRKWVYDELRAQVDRIVTSGLAPTHLDTHKHTHLVPSVLDAVCRVSQEFRIPWVRRPFDLPLEGSDNGVPWTKRTLSRGLGGLRRRFHARLERYGCRTTDHFAGFQMTGYLQERQLVRLIEMLPEGTTEFMCHPGFCTSELQAMSTRLKESRANELAALTSPGAREALGRAGVALASYRQLSA
jgi:predicted glycoside hydrolase/deacetylase ChbG (UPF0249 family)